MISCTVSLEIVLLQFSINYFVQRTMLTKILRCNLLQHFIFMSLLYSTYNLNLFKLKKKVLHPTYFYRRLKSTSGICIEDSHLRCM
jgi:hypothetical protein